MLADNVARLTAPDIRVVLRAAGIAFLICLTLLAAIVLGNRAVSLIYARGWLEILRPYRDLMMAVGAAWAVLFALILQCWRANLFRV
jgi:hypothetical protein